MTVDAKLVVGGSAREAAKRWLAEQNPQLAGTSTPASIGNLSSRIESRATCTLCSVTPSATGESPLPDGVLGLQIGRATNIQGTHGCRSAMEVPRRWAMRLSNSGIR